MQQLCAAAGGRGVLVCRQAAPEVFARVCLPIPAVARGLAVCLPWFNVPIYWGSPTHSCHLLGAVWVGRASTAPRIVPM
jgi:hypothetical protein